MRYRLSFLIACAQLAMVVIYISILTTSEGLGELAVIWPLMGTLIIAPVNFFTASYYLIFKREEPMGRKIIVGVSLLVSIAFFFVASRDRLAA